MPIYEYRCKSCQNDFEVLVMKSSDEKEAECPLCASHAVERVLSCFSKTTGAESSTSHSSCSSHAGGFS